MSLAAYEKVTPTYTLTLDAGVFRWLEEVVAAKRTYAENQKYPVTMPEYYDMLVRAVTSFDEARQATNSRIEEAVKPKGTRQIKQVTKRPK